MAWLLDAIVMSAVIPEYKENRVELRCQAKSCGSSMISLPMRLSMLPLREEDFVDVIKIGADGFHGAYGVVIGKVVDFLLHVL